MSRLATMAVLAIGVCLGGWNCVSQAANFTGASGNWSTPENWSTMMVPAGGLGGEDAAINRDIDVTVTVNSVVPAFDQFQTVNTTTATPNTITLMIEDGADLQMNAYSRLGRNGNTNGDTSQVIMTGGSFRQVSEDFHFGWDPPSPSTIYFEVSGGMFDVFDEFRIGQSDLGNVNPNDENDMITAPDKIEFHVKGSGATIAVGEIHFESNPDAVDPWNPVIHFSLDAGGVSPIVVDGQGDSALGRITFEDSTMLQLDILDAAAPNSATLMTSLTPSAGTLLNDSGVPINAGDQVSAGVFAGFEYLYNVYFDSNLDGSGTPGLYLANLTKVESMGGLPGDFSGNGAVENADLTLLLNNWAQPATPVPAGWIGDPQPTDPAIDNDELTALLNNWGNSLGNGSGGQVPEPGSLALCLFAILGIGRGRRRPSQS